jgi:hypothetical protein
MSKFITLTEEDIIEIKKELEFPQLNEDISENINQFEKRLESIKNLKDLENIAFGLLKDKEILKHENLKDECIKSVREYGGDADIKLLNKRALFLLKIAKYQTNEEEIKKNSEFLKKSYETTKIKFNKIMDFIDKKKL